MGGVAEEFENLRRARPDDPADELGERVLFRIMMREGALPPEAKADLAFAKMKDAARRLIKAGFDPSQPRDESGRWTDGGGSAQDGGGGAGPAFERVVADMLSASTLPIVRVGAFDDVDKRQTVQEFASKNCIGSIQRELPGQFLNKSLEEVIELRDAGDKAARKCLKLLGSGRFQK